METKYPALRRPKRKLCYLTDKDKPSKQWIGTLKLEDVDKIFDDLDPSMQDDEEEENGGLLSSSPLLHISDADTTQSEREAHPVSNEEQQMEKVPRCQMAPDGDVLRPMSRSPSPKLDFDLNGPITGPVKTSSPIEKNMVEEGVEELDSEREQIVSPVLFDCEDEGKEEAKIDPLPMQKLQKPQCNRDVTEQMDCAELDSPPCNIVLSKPKMSNHKNKEDGSCKQSDPVKEKAPSSQIPTLGGQRKALGQENTVRQEPEVAAKKKPDSVPRQPSVEASTRVGKDMTTFLQKLRLGSQPKPACSRKPLSPVKVPTPPEPEDDFLILEDDRPLWFSIPSKTKRHRDNGTSSTDKDSSSDKAAKDSPLKTAQKEQESEANGKLGSQIVNQKMKKMKGNEKKKELTETGNDMAELSSPEDLPAGELTEQEKPKERKQRVKKADSKQRDEAEEQPKDTASRESDEEKPTQKKEKKAQRSSDMKRSKSLKDGNENAKMSRAKSLKGGRKVTQEPGAVKEMVHSEAVKEQSQTSEKHTNTEDPGSLSDQEIVNSEEQTDEEDKLNKLPSEESSSEDSRILGKRKRRPTGQWWLSCPQSTEKTKATDIQPTLKKSKQSNREPSTAVPSPVKTKKDRVLKRNQTQPTPSSTQNTKRAKEKVTKQNKNRNTRQDTPSKVKASKVSNVLEGVQVEEQEQQQEDQDQDQDQDPFQSSPLVFAYRDHSLNTGDQVFQRVYHHVSNDKTAITPASVSSRGSTEQLGAAEKRRRKPPNNWWLVNGMSEAVESISSQPQQQGPKARKDRRKLTKQSRSPGLGTPKHGNMVVKPPGGTPVPPVKVKPLLSRKTVKHSPALFKDIITSATKTPAVVSSREAGRSIRGKAVARPAVGVTVTDWSSPKNTEEVFSIDAGEPDSPLNHETPQDGECQSENTLKAFRSGPSSMIELEQYEDNDDLILPSSRLQDVLSASDMCAPPLKPLILEPKDKANLTEWFKSFCSTTVDNGSGISPDQFDWYFYRGRAIGFLVDLNSGSICNGKILLGSFMKKPLQVDHRATTVFHLITSSVSVTIDGRKSRFNPVQSFIVPCGHAYSIQNVTAQPAVLCFTRMLADSSD